MPPTEINVALYAAVVASVHEHFERGTLERGLPSFEAPFTVIHGLQDPLPAEAGRKTAALVPHARFEAIDDCGHIPWLERPAEFRAAVDRALSAG
jgi:pimeloyl-ACP methyl ester carboxylesterase